MNETEAISFVIRDRISETPAERQRRRRSEGGPAYRAILAAKEQQRRVKGGQVLRDHQNALARERRARRNPPVPIIDSFFARVDATGDCWIWTGHRQPEGYGHVRFEGRDQGAHRVAYRLLVGEIPDGYQLDHLCRVPACVNPDHLEPVTLTENLRRGFQRAEMRHRTKCRNGHPYTLENTTITRRGTRICRSCHQAGEIRYQQRRRTAA